MTVRKTRVPHPKDAKSDADHLAFAQHMMEQIAAGHYKASGISVSRTDHGNAENRTHKRHFSMSFTVEDADPSVEPAPAPTPASA